jgi:hypothetical protein
MYKFSIVLIFLVCPFVTNAQDFVTTQKNLHRSFHQSFKTTDYQCTISNVSEITYDIKSDKWTIDNSGKFHLGRKEFIRIIKSDDITTPIPLCGARDEPQANFLKDDKYFCLISVRPRSNSIGERLLFPDPDKIDATHYKCLLDIKQNTGKQNVNTLVCNSNFKFVLNFAKYFSSDLVLGPYRDFPQEKLSQRYETADCSILSK